MIKVSIISQDIRNQAGIGKLTQKPYNMNFQVGWAYMYAKDGTPNPFPEKFDIILENDQHGLPKAYPKGDYQLHPGSFYMGKYGIEVAPKLVALKA